MVYKNGTIIIAAIVITTMVIYTTAKVRGY